MKKIISILLSAMLLSGISAAAAEYPADMDTYKLADWRMSMELENEGTKDEGYRVVNSVKDDSNGDIWINSPDTTMQQGGVSGAAATLTGTSDYMTVFDDPIGKMLNGCSELTVATWVKFDAFPAENETLMLVDEDGAFRIAVSHSGELHVAMNTDRVDWYAETINVDSAITPNKWYHIAVTMDDSGATLYINGIRYMLNENLKGTITAPDNCFLSLGGISKNGQGLGYAQTPITRSFDDTVIYSKALTMAQIKRIAATPAIYLDGEKSGDNALKNRGIVGDITLANAAETSTDKNGMIGKAISYTAAAASNSIAQLWHEAHNGILEFSDSMTFSSWVKPTGDGQVKLFDRDESYSVILLEDGTVRFILASGDKSWYENFVTTTAKLTKNEWAHIAAVYDGVKIKIYINGVLDVEADASGNITYNSGWGIYSPVYICCAEKAGAGVDIDEFMAYDYALTAEEIAELASPVKAEIAVRNLVGDTVNTVVGGSKVYADAYGITAKEQSSPLVLILAAYDANDTLIDIDFVDTVISKDGGETPEYLFTNVMTIPNNVEGAVKVKAFLWDSFDLMTPYM